MQRFGISIIGRRGPNQAWWVVDVSPGSVAALAGLRRGDIVYALNKSSPDGFASDGGFDTLGPIQVGVQRAGEERLSLTMMRRPLAIPSAPPTNTERMLVTKIASVTSESALDQVVADIWSRHGDGELDEAATERLQAALDRRRAKLAPSRSVTEKLQRDAARDAREQQRKAAAKGNFYLEREHWGVVVHRNGGVTADALRLASEVRNLLLNKPGDPRHGECFASLRTLSEKVGISQERVQAADAELERHGLVKVIRGGGYRNPNRRMPMIDGEPAITGAKLPPEPGPQVAETETSAPFELDQPELLPETPATDAEHDAPSSLLPGIDWETALTSGVIADVKRPIAPPELPGETRPLRRQRDAELRSAEGHPVSSEPPDPEMVEHLVETRSVTPAEAERMAASMHFINRTLEDMERRQRVRTNHQSDYDPLNYGRYNPDAYDPLRIGDGTPPDDGLRLVQAPRRDPPRKWYADDDK